MWSGVGGSRVGALPLHLTLSRPLPGVAYKVLDVRGVVNQRYSIVKIRAHNGLGCDAAAPCGVGLVYGALVGVYVTRSYSDFSQSTVEAHPTFGLLKIQYAVRSTDARKIFTPHEPVVGVLGLAVTPPRRGANALSRRFGGAQSTVGSHPTFGAPNI